jgi:hypothetical protein
VENNSSSPALSGMTGLIPSSRPRPGLLPPDLEERAQRLFAPPPAAAAPPAIDAWAKRVCAQWAEVKEFRRKLKRAQRRAGLQRNAEG